MVVYTNIFDGIGNSGNRKLSQCGFLRFFCFDYIIADSEKKISNKIMEDELGWKKVDNYARWLYN